MINFFSAVQRAHCPFIGENGFACLSIFQVILYFFALIFSFQIWVLKVVPFEFSLLKFVRWPEYLSLKLLAVNPRNFGFPPFRFYNCLMNYFSLLALPLQGAFLIVPTVALFWPIIKGAPGLTINYTECTRTNYTGYTRTNYTECTRTTIQGKPRLFIQGATGLIISLFQVYFRIA